MVASDERDAIVIANANVLMICWAQITTRHPRTISLKETQTITYLVTTYLVFYWKFFVKSVLKYIYTLKEKVLKNVHKS